MSVAGLATDVFYLGRSYPPFETGRFPPWPVLVIRKVCSNYTGNLHRERTTNRPARESTSSMHALSERNP